MATIRPKTVRRLHQERSQQTRQALLASGLHLFQTKGYARTSPKEVAAHAGAAVGSFYRYFTDKRQLLLEIVQDHLDEQFPAEPQKPSGQTGAQMIEEILTHTAEPWPLTQELKSLARHDPEATELVAQAQERVLVRLMVRLGHHASLGRIWPDLPLQTLAWAIHALADRAREQGRLQDAVMRADLARVIARMLMPPGVAGTCPPEATDPS